MPNSKDHRYGIPMSPGAVETIQKNADDHGQEIFATYGLIGSVMLFGAIGFGVDRLLASRPYGLVIGLAAGLLIGFAQLLRAARH